MKWRPGFGVATSRVAPGFHRLLALIHAGPSVEILAFRWLVVLCQATTIVLTWPLWRNHENPPMLPALALPAFDVGSLLLLSLALVIFLPLGGIAFHTLIMLYAVLIDQTRLQPEFVSLLFLMWGTLPFPTTRALVRAHLISLWFFAGFHKLVSPGFIDGTAQWILSAFLEDPHPWLQANVGYIIGSMEISLGLLAIFSRTRWLVGWLAVAVHGGILFVLLPTGNDWNSAVWPWNVALALAGFVFIARWQESAVSLFTRCQIAIRPLMLWVLLAPLGFYVGITDAYLAHHVYSSSTATVESSAFSSAASWEAFNVPMPPEHRLYKQYFEITCNDGDIMVITDTRWWYREKGLAVQRIACPRS